MRRRALSSPYFSSLLLWLLLSGVFFVVAETQLPVSWLLNLLLALNFAAFVLYGLDKLLAMGRLWRIPEKVLWFSAFFGGPLGALLGMYVFRHKVSKISFQFWLAVVILLEIGLVMLYLD